MFVPAAELNCAVFLCAVRDGEKLEVQHLPARIVLMLLLRTPCLQFFNLSATFCGLQPQALPFVCRAGHHQQAEHPAGGGGGFEPLSGPGPPVRRAAAQTASQ